MSKPAPRASVCEKYITLCKLYRHNKTDKSTGFGDNWNYKLIVYRSMCFTVGIQEDGDLLRCLSLMLDGMARDVYHAWILGKQDGDFPTACQALEEFFEGPEWAMQAIEEWNAIPLASVKNQEPVMSTRQALLKLVTTLMVMRFRLPPHMRGDEYLRDRIIDACMSDRACSAACANPGREVFRLVQQLQSSIFAYEARYPPRTPKR